MEITIHQNEMFLPTEPQTKKGGRPRGSSDRYPRYTRASGDFPGFGQSPYDPLILDAVYRYRALTRQRIEELVAPNLKRTRVGERLQKLYHHGFLVRRVMPLDPPQSLIVYLLDRKGAEQVAVMRQCALEDLEGWDAEDKNISTFFLKHLLLVSDVYTAFARSASECGYVLDTWLDGRRLKKNHRHDAITIRVTNKYEEERALSTHLYPDGYLFVRLNAETREMKCHRFVEIDRATETLSASVEAPSSWGVKVKRYLAYFEQGKFAARYKAEGMVVLTVTTNERRLENLKRTTEREDGGERFWFTTVERLFAPGVNVLTDSVWSRAGAQGLFTFTENLVDLPPA
jgi:hypothetical protein